MELTQILLIIAGIALIGLIYWKSRQRHQEMEERLRARRNQQEQQWNDKPISDSAEQSATASAPKVKSYRDTLAESGEEIPELNITATSASDSASEAQTQAVSKPVQSEQPKPASEPISAPTSAQKTDPKSTKPAGEQLVIALHILSKTGSSFQGPDLLREFENLSLEFGKMDIFHRFSAQNRKEPLFSIANAMKPGTFDHNAMDKFETTGIVLFCQFPSSHPGGQAFEQLASSAKTLCTALDGRLMDEKRRPLGSQSLQQMRDQVNDFIYRQELAQKG